MNAYLHNDTFCPDYYEEKNGKRKNNWVFRALMGMGTGVLIFTIILVIVVGI